MDRLTQKQETFCLKYMELGHATNAAIAAGYSPKTAQTISSENLSKPLIIERIEALRAENRLNARKTSDDKLNRLETFIDEDNKDQYGYRRHGNIAAIKEHNLMTGVYETDSQAPEVKVQTFVFILPDGTKVIPKQLKAGNPLYNGNNRREGD